MRIFSGLLRSIERRAEEEEAKLQRAEELLRRRRLEEEIGELRKDARLGQRSLSLNTSHLTQVQRRCPPKPKWTEIKLPIYTKSAVSQWYRLHK